MPDHSIDSPKCVQNRAESVRAAQLRADIADKLEPLEGYEDFERGKYMVD